MVGLTVSASSGFLCIGWQFYWWCHFVSRFLYSLAEFGNTIVCKFFNCFSCVLQFYYRCYPCLPVQVFFADVGSSIGGVTVSAGF